MNLTSSDFGSALFLGVLSFFILWVGVRRKFFLFDDQKERWKTPLCWYHVLFVFGIYFFLSAFLAPLLSRLLYHFNIFGPENVLEWISWLNFIASALIFLSLGIYFLSLPKELSFSILKRENKLSLKEDFQAAIFAWILSFPLVLFMSHLLEFLVERLFHLPELPEQLAVHFLKMTFDHPFYFTLAVITIVVLAPLIEEFLFRGVFQSFIRKHLGSKQAILITSLCFSFFHYSPEQGFGNIAIIGSLFVLALFLGFLYEKRGSLFAPIFLHATFNGISVLNLYFLGDFPKGPL